MGERREEKRVEMRIRKGDRRIVEEKDEVKQRKNRVEEDRDQKIEEEVRKDEGIGIVQMEVEEERDNDKRRREV
ncbi:hypothetical protein Tco_0051652 [Tanacetum coccineum]